MQASAPHPVLQVASVVQRSFIACQRSGMDDPAMAATRIPSHQGHEGRGDGRWSRPVTETSNALDLREGVFELEDPAAIACSLKQSAERSHRRKSDPYRSAMSMLTFYINRAGDNLPAERRKTLEAAKDELRALFDRPRRH
jgi:hypothetical protein